MLEKITYDQPLNETVRVCLRLEQLFHQIDHQINDSSLLGARNIINYIINLLHILDRPDLKAKLAKELSHHLSNLSRYEKIPEIDPEKLNTLTHQLENHSRSLIDSSGKIGNRLRDIELLNTLRLHLASPGGGCSFDLPIYHYWLEQSPLLRQETINNWLSEFAQIRTVSELILTLVRNNAKVEEKIAIHGFYQELLDPQANMRMLRISIANDIHAYPEISIGRHFLSVRFFSPDIEKRPPQYPDNLNFWISYCNG
jgi:cell division protein ZapD